MGSPRDDTCRLSFAAFYPTAKFLLCLTTQCLQQVNLLIRLDAQMLSCRAVISWYFRGNLLLYHFREGAKWLELAPITTKRVFIKLRGGRHLPGCSLGFTPKILITFLLSTCYRRENRKRVVDCPALFATVYMHMNICILCMCVNIKSKHLDQEFPNFFWPCTPTFVRMSMYP